MALRCHLACLASLLVATAGAACGSEDQRGSTPGADREPGGMPRDKPHDPAVRELNNRSEHAREARRLRRKMVHLPSGAVVILPPKPTRYSSDPTGGCRDVTENGRTVSFPPRPGVSASWTADRRLEVHYEFGSTPGRCRPTVLELSVDINADGLGVRTLREPIDELHGTTVLDVPASFSDADVFISRARTAIGAPGDASSVLIR